MVNPAPRVDLRGANVARRTDGEYAAAPGRGDADGRRAMTDRRRVLPVRLDMGGNPAVIGTNSLSKSSTGATASSTAPALVGPRVRLRAFRARPPDVATVARRVGLLPAGDAMDANNAAGDAGTKLSSPAPPDAWLGVPVRPVDTVGEKAAAASPTLPCPRCMRRFSRRCVE